MQLKKTADKNPKSIEHTDDLLKTERDFGLALCRARTFEEMLSLALSFALRLSGIEAGGIYVAQEDGSMRLGVSEGLTAEFLKHVERIEAGSDQGRLLKKGVPIYADYSEINRAPDSVRKNEGLKTMAVIPVFHRRKLLGCLNVASKVSTQISGGVRAALESLASRVGSPIAQAKKDEEIRASYANLKRLFDSIGDLMFVLDTGGRIIATNDMVSRRLGYSERELKKMHVSDVHPPSNRDDVGRVVEDMLQNRDPLCEIPLLTKRGELIPVETRVVLGVWSGEPALFGISRDVTVQRKNEKRISHLLDEQRLLLDTIPVQLWFLSDPLHYGRVNRAHARFLGRDTCDLENKSLFDIFPDRSAAEVCLAGNKTVFSDKSSITTREWVKNSAGTPRLLEINKTPALDPDGNISSIVCAANDVTEKYHADLEAKKKIDLISLMTELSVFFISQPADAIDPGVNVLLQSLGQYFRADRAYLFLFHGALMTNTHEWCAPGVTPQIEQLKNLPLSLFPWWVRKLRNRQFINIYDVRELTAEAQSERDILAEQGIRSVLAAPVFLSAELLGFLGFDTVAEKRRWTGEERDVLKIAAEMIANINEKRLQREKIEKSQHALAHEKNQIQKILDSLPVGVIQFDSEGVVRFCNRVVERIWAQNESVIRGRGLSFLFDQNEKQQKAVSDLIARKAWPEEKIPLAIENAAGEKRHLLVSRLDTVFENDKRIVLIEDITEVVQLKEDKKINIFHGMVYRSSTMKEMVEHIRFMAQNDFPVLIHGETGSGKEMVAKAIHAESGRKKGRFIVVNCAGLTDSLLASQLFGHRKGAFTGAVQDVRGAFEMADGGTLFLDEIGDASDGMQKMILRVVEDGVFRPLGSMSEKKVNIRIVAATNRDLRGSEFRKDLFFRLAAFRVFVPPLRDRKEDIPGLARHFLDMLDITSNLKLNINLDEKALEMLINYDWPGNVREMKNAISRLAYGGGVNGMIFDWVPDPAIGGQNQEGPFRETEAQRIERALETCGGNRSRAAKSLGLSRSTFYRRLRKYHKSCRNNCK